MAFNKLAGTLFREGVFSGYSWYELIGNGTVPRGNQPCRHCQSVDGIVVCPNMLRVYGNGGKESVIVCFDCIRLHADHK